MPSISQLVATKERITPSIAKPGAAQMRITSHKTIYVFLELTLALSAVPWVLMIWSGHWTMGNGLLIPTIMWSPGIAALATCRLTGKDVRLLGWRWPQTRYLVAAYFVPFAYTSIAYGAVWTLHIGALNSDFVKSTVDELGLNGMPAWGAFVLSILFVATGGVIQNASMTLGEEIGWRGLLVSELVSDMSFSKTSLVSGLIWAAWHSPLLLLADYNAGTNRWYSLGCFTTTCISMGFMLTWFRLKCNSVWPAVVLHASHNVFVPIIFDSLTRDVGSTLLYTTVFGAAPACTTAMFALYFWIRRKEIQRVLTSRNDASKPKCLTADYAKAS